MLAPIRFSHRTIRNKGAIRPGLTSSSSSNISNQPPRKKRKWEMKKKWAHKENKGTGGWHLKRNGSSRWSPTGRTSGFLYIATPSSTLVFFFFLLSFPRPGVQREEVTSAPQTSYFTDGFPFTFCAKKDRWEPHRAGRWRHTNTHVGLIF
jgi:hypothetical protein